MARANTICNTAHWTRLIECLKKTAPPAVPVATKLNTGKTATFDMPGAASGGEGFVVLLQKGTPERPGAILAVAKTEGL